ncbi:GNAT family N-acetyltransferase [Candidatus Saccharibacteria bacterium]|nr:MAG: GNAT family N-acetyltransferase [Candidatus Saccharibacteria bacterium]
MNIEIAPAIEEDIPDIQSILSHGIRSKMYRGDLAWGETTTDETNLKAIVAGGNMYVAHTDEEIVGVFMLFWDDLARWGKQPPIAGYLHRFVVAPGLRGQHVGSQIIDLICAEVAKQGRQYLRLTCPSDNEKLQSYHLSHGFVRADSKAVSSHLPQPMAYFERHVSGTTEQPSLASQDAKKKFRFPFTQRYE